jgi:hypothetical protein
MRLAEICVRSLANQVNMSDCSVTVSVVLIWQVWMDVN